MANFFCVPTRLILTVVALTATASLSFASTITFETAPGLNFTGPVTESGYVYSNLSGFLYVNVLGNPGQDMEGEDDGGGGVLKIVAVGGGDFTLATLDFAAYDLVGTGSQTLTINGYLGALLVGTDTYTLANTNSTISGGYDNWTTESASLLAGQAISEIDIVLNAGHRPNNTNFQEAVDNVVLDAVAPEPASLVLFGTGSAVLWFLRRRSKD